MKRLSSFLMGSLVLAASSMGVADTTTTDMVIKAQHFDAASGLLSGLLSGGASAEFLRTGTTSFQATDPTQLPPGPCRSIAKVWNVAVADSAPRIVFDLLMFDMSLAKCDARVAITTTTPTSGGAPPMIAIKPGH